METPEQAARRKNDHIRICTEAQVEGSNPLGNRAFSRVQFVPEALPEMSLEDVDTTVGFLGRTFAMPLLITGMTGGVERGQEINETLALAAQQFNIPMGLGSQKVMVGRPDFQSLFDVRKCCPGVFLIGNLGAMSFNYGLTLDDVKRLAGSLALDAFAFHLNALQETIQPEGERDFSDLLRPLERAVRELPIPVMVKEVGSGLSVATFRRLLDIGVKVVDVGGRGGTSWSAIEGLRGDDDTRRLGELFRDWGLSTESSLKECARENRRHGSPVEIVATGGIRDGLQVAKAVALGAQMAGVGLPLFKAAVGGSPVTQGSSNQSTGGFEAVCRELAFFKRSLEISMFCSGARRLSDLSTRIREGNDWA